MDQELSILIETRNNELFLRPRFTIENDGLYCFDDIGVEPTRKSFGVACNVMG